MRVSRTRDHKLFNYSRTGYVREEVMDTKYLGVTFSNDLEWSKHIATITNNSSFKQYLRRNLKGYPNADYSLICSFLEYGATVWNQYQKYNSEKFEKTQRNATCFVKSSYGSYSGVLDILMSWDSRLFLRVPEENTIRKSTDWSYNWPINSHFL